MKKYQLWLQRKCYSQHLDNLMKIKHSRYLSAHADSRQSRPADENCSPHRHADHSMRSSANKLGDIIYCITEKQRRNCKVRVMKSFQIRNDNLNMARRIHEARPAVDSNLERSAVGFGRRKIFQKNCELTHNELREKNFRTFMRWKKKVTHCWSRSELRVEVKSISRVWRSEEMGMWCEVKGQRGWVRSDLVSAAGQFMGGVFSFLLEEELAKELALRVFICRGLDSEMIGEFRIAKPEEGEGEVFCKSEDGRTQAEMKISYSTIRRERPVLNLK